MPIILTCPCGRTLRAKDDQAGRACRCPACGTTLQVPYPVAKAVESTGRGFEIYRDRQSSANLRPQPRAQHPPRRRTIYPPCRGTAQRYAAQRRPGPFTNPHRPAKNRAHLARPRLFHPSPRHPPPHPSHLFRQTRHRRPPAKAPPARRRLPPQIRRRRHPQPPRRNPHQAPRPPPRRRVLPARRLHLSHLPRHRRAALFRRRRLRDSLRRRRAHRSHRRRRIHRHHRRRTAAHLPILRHVLLPHRHLVHRRTQPRHLSGPACWASSSASASPRKSPNASPSSGGCIATKSPGAAAASSEWPAAPASASPKESTTATISTTASPP